MCRYGQGVVRGLFEALKGEAIKGFSVYLPMMGGDNEDRARVEAEAFRDARVSHFWDSKAALGQLYARTLGLKSLAWDVYFLYAPGVRWEGDEPPQPTFWMHQLPVDTGVDGKLLLDPGTLSRETLQLLGKQADDENLALRLHGQGLMWLTRARTQYSMDEPIDAARESPE